jgi:hypothetical protein
LIEFSREELTFPPRCSPSVTAYPTRVPSGGRMSLMSLVSEFLLKGKELCRRMRSAEGKTLSRADLHVLREQLRLLDIEASNLLNEKQGRE